jgi:cell wall assembly regulator SMI1
LLACTVTIMKADEAVEVLRGLVAGAIRAPEEEAPRGASPAEIDSLQASLGCGIPPVLRAWLSVCRGVGIGPGGVFGPRPDEPYLDMAHRRDLFPEWAEQGWLPVAGDGCGNCYVLMPDGTVGFVDTMKDPGRIDRQAAADLLSFMTGLLADDQDLGRARA